MEMVAVSNTLAYSAGVWLQLQYVYRTGPRDRIHNTSFSSVITNQPNKRECLSLASLSRLVMWHSSWLNPFVSY